MSQDQQTYQGGRVAAATGLLVQIALSIGVALIGLWAQSPAINAAFFHYLGGVLIWTILLIVYHQHRLERVEALEAERLAKGDATAAALFEEAADDLDLARRRLTQLYTYGLNIFGVLVAVYLIAISAFMLYSTWPDYVADELGNKALNQRARLNTLILVFLTAVPGFIAFVVARYVSGMTSVREWQLLRGGASYMMGNVVISVALTVGAVFAYLENDNVFGALSLIIPAIMGLIGVEVLLTFILSAYRPRRPGEIPRPAFDSRVLGWFTSPESLGRIVAEAVNYQFGFEISRSWFYQLLNRWSPALFFVGAIVLWLMSAIIVVEPHQRALVTTFGGQPRIVEPGIQLKNPWPIDTLKLYEIERVHTVTVGSTKAKADPDVAILWTNPHFEGSEDGGKEGYMLVGPSKRTSGRVREGLTTIATTDDLANSGMALLAVEVTVQYQIGDLMRFVQVADDPEEMLMALADEVVNEFMASHGIDELLGVGRSQIGHALRSEIQKAADALGGEGGMGVKIVYVGTPGIHPPQQNEVAASFHEEIGAIQEKQKLIQEAEQEANRQLAEVAGSRDKGEQINQAIQKIQDLKRQLDTLTSEDAGDEAAAKAQMIGLEEAIRQYEANVEELLDSTYGSAAEAMFEARAYRWQRSVTERAKAERFASELQAYRQAPSYYRMRSILDTYASQMGRARKIVLTADTVEEPLIRLDLKDSSSAAELIDDVTN